MRAQIAITRNGITQASSDKSPPEGGVLARRTNGDFLISLHRHVSETALVQMMRSLRARPGLRDELEMAETSPVTCHARIPACGSCARSAFSSG